MRKPDFLKINKIPVGERASFILKVIKENRINTVCTEALCPNKGKCFGEGTATFLILGPNCTRNCKFCNVKHSQPLPEDFEEPYRIADAVKKLNLNYVVITSVSRDDLEDKGANAFVRTIRAIREVAGNDIKIEILTPDFMGEINLLKIVIDEKPFVFNHNLETVRRLTNEIRSGASYERSLKVLKMAKELNKNQITKSGIIIGLGETKEEIYETLCDLKEAMVDRITIGQYLQPSKAHLEVQKYYSLEEFEELKEKSHEIGFRWVQCGPFVRSSYLAGREL